MEEDEGGGERKKERERRNHGKNCGHFRIPRFFPSFERTYPSRSRSRHVEDNLDTA